MLLNKLRMTLACHQPQTHGQFLHNIKDGHQNELQGQKFIAPLRPALRRRDNAAGIRIGQHNHQPGPHDKHESLPATPAGCFRGYGHGIVLIHFSIAMPLSHEFFSAK